MLSYSLCKTIITYLNEAYIRLRDNADNKNVHEDLYRASQVHFLTSVFIFLFYSILQFFSQ